MDAERHSQELVCTALVCYGKHLMRVMALYLAQWREEVGRGGDLDDWLQAHAEVHDGMMV